jgi:hypothetical protein
MPLAHRTATADPARGERRIGFARIRTHAIGALRERAVARGLKKSNLTGEAHGWPCAAPRLELRALWSRAAESPVSFVSSGTGHNHLPRYSFLEEQHEGARQDDRTFLFDEGALDRAHPFDLRIAIAKLSG